MFLTIFKKKTRRKTEKELQHYQELQNSDDKSKKSVSSVAESVESGEILSSRNEWNTGSNKLFVTYLSNNENKLEKSIQNNLDLFINASLNTCLLDLVFKANLEIN